MKINMDVYVVDIDTNVVFRQDGALIGSADITVSDGPLQLNIGGSTDSSGSLQSFRVSAGFSIGLPNGASLSAGSLGFGYTPDGGWEWAGTPPTLSIPLPGGEVAEFPLDEGIQDLGDLLEDFLDNAMDARQRQLAMQEELAMRGLNPNDWMKYLGVPGIDPFAERIDPRTNTTWQQAMQSVPRRDPLVLDLNGNGIETLPADGTVLFDASGNGTKVGTGWIAPTDGLLAIDKNGNGLIDDGTELFGDAYMKADGSVATNGFDALSDLDSNQDGKIDSTDAAWSQLKIWRDADSDGLTDSGELIALGAVNGVGIKQINLASTPGTESVGNGNIAIASGTFEWNGGSIGITGSAAKSLNLAQNPFYRVFPALVVPVSHQDLPNMQGSGAVRDLQEAATLSTSLEDTLRQYGEATTRAEQMSLLDKLIEDWARSNTLMGDWVQRLEDQTIDRNVGGDMAVRFMVTYTGAHMGNPDLVLNGVNLYWDDETSVYLAHKNYGGNELRVGRFADNAQLEALAKLRILEVFNHQEFFNFDFDSKDTNNDGIDDTVTNGVNSGAVAYVLSKSVGGGGGGAAPPSEVVIKDDDIRLDSNQINFINESYEQLRGSIYVSLLSQTRLKPYMDEISLRFDAASNEFLFDFVAFDAKFESRKLADAKNAYYDLIDLNRYAGPRLWEQGWGGLEKLRSWVQSAIGNVELQSVLAETHVQIVTGNASGSAFADVFLGQGLADTLHGWDGDDLLDGKAGVDRLYGDNGNDLLLGGDGSDSLYGGAGSDTLDGGVGNDLILGDNGNDTLDGGVGNDSLQGGSGSDTYLFGRGYGQDTVYDPATSATGVKDEIRFKAGVLPSQILVRQRRLGHLELSIIGTTDMITVSSFFNGYGNPNLQITFADDPTTVWKLADIQALAIVPTAGVDSIWGYGGGDLLHGDAGNDHVNGWAGNDTIHGDDGNDELVGDEGNDTLYGGANVDTLYGDNGNDVLDGGGSGDTLYGGAGNDILDGGTGNDTLTGQSGNDTYLFGRGDGQDLMYDAPVAGGSEEIRFKEGVLPSDVLVRARKYGVLELSIIGTSDMISMSDYFANGGHPNLRVTFADDTSSIWTLEDIKAMAIVPTAGNDSIWGYAGGDVLEGAAGNDGINGWGGDDTIHGGDGSDELLGYDGNDTLYGDAGNDDLRGEAGSDILDGGAGNDLLYGGTGSDTYLFGRGDGQDTLSEGAAPGVSDEIRFKAGVLPGDVFVRQQRNGVLELTIVGTQDKLIVPGYFTSTGNFNERVTFVDDPATVWTLEDIKALALLGTAGNDSIWGYAGADILDGAAGDDGVNGWGGNDTIHGGDGNDELIGSDGDDTLYGDANVDKLYGDNGNDVLEGGGSVDSLYGGSGNDTLDGGAGNDILQGQGGVDLYLFGRGDGQDTMYEPRVAGVTDEIRFKAGILPSEVYVRQRRNGVLELSIVGTTDMISITDYFVGYGNPNLIITFADDPSTVWSLEDIKPMVLVPTTGTDSIWGFGGGDVLHGDAGNDHINGWAGNDTIHGDDGSDELIGSDGDDTLYGDAGNDSMYGEIGNDVLDGGIGVDRMDGGTGNDTYYVSISTDAVNESANAGTDKVYSAVSYTLGLNVESLVLLDGAAIVGGGNILNNSITGNAGNNTLNGNAGDDVLEGMAGADSLNGGDGNDNVSYASAGSGVMVALDIGDGTGGGFMGDSDGDTLLNIENLTGSSFDDMLFGNAAANIVSGGSGDDQLDGMGGADQLIGGDGSDLGSYRNSTTGVSVDLVTGIGAGGDASGDQLSSVEHLHGSDFADTLIGTSGTNTLIGFEGDDFVKGGGGADFLMGNEGHDTVSYEGLSGGVDVVLQWNGVLDDGHGFYGTSEDLLGSFENIVGTDYDDVFYGSDADNTLWGRGGSDTLLGGAGSDVLIGGTGADYLLGSDGSDRYLAGRGDGQDILFEDDASTTDNTDVLQFGSGIAVDQLWFRHIGNDLEVSIIGTTDSVTIVDWYSGSNTHIEQFVSNNGQILLDSQVETLVTAMAAFSPPGPGQTTLPPSYESALGAVIAANWQ